MRKIGMLCIFITSFVAGSWLSISGSNDSPVPPDTWTMKSDTLGAYVRTAVFGLTEEDTTIDSKDFKRIQIPEEYIDRDTTRAGKPQIPYVRLLVAVPDSASYSIDVYESDHTLFEDYLLYPVPRIEWWDSGGITYFKEVYTYDTTFYDKDTIYPGKFHEVVSDGHWRDQRVLEVNLYPVQFNPDQELTYFYNGLDLRIEYSGTVVENPRGLGPFEDIAREILVNYPGIHRQVPANPSPAVYYYTKLDTVNYADYVVVTHEDFIADSTDSANIHEWAEWRVDHNNFDVGIVQMTDVYEEFLGGGETDSAAALKEFLDTAYVKWIARSMPDSHFAYSLLIGDWDYVPTNLDSAEHGWEGFDSLYRDLGQAGRDDIMLGRWPAKQTNDHEVVTIAQKTRKYEKYPVTDTSFRRTGLVTGSNKFSVDRFELWVDTIAPFFTDIGYDTVKFKKSVLGSNSAWCDSVYTHLNTGEILMTYIGHGSHHEFQPGFDTIAVDTLANSSRLPVILAGCCYTADFAWDKDGIGGTSLGERFLFHDSAGVGSPTAGGSGAVAYYGTPNGTRQWLNPVPLARIILREQYWILGRAIIANQQYKTSDWNLLGDPALDLGDYTAFPNLPDLVIRPRALDIKLTEPFPYPTNGDSIPIRTKVFNIGGSLATNVEVAFRVELDDDTLYHDTITIDTIFPRDTAIAITKWYPAQSQPSYYGDMGECHFYVTADPDDQITESWESNNESKRVSRVALYPNETGWPVKVTGFAQPALADVNDTTTIEIVYPSLDSVYVFEKDGSVLTGWPKYFKDVYGVVLGDVYSATKGTEIVAVSPDSIKVYDYQGNVLSGWPEAIRYSNYEFEGLPALDPDIGGPFLAPEIVVIAKKTGGMPWYTLEKVKIFHYSYNGVRQDAKEDSTTKKVYESHRLNGPAVVEVKSGGGKEAILSYGFSPNDVSSPYDVDSFFTEIFNTSGSQKLLSLGSNRMTPAFIDPNSDGYYEMIIGSVSDSLIMYRTSNDSVLWATTSGGGINSSPAIGDINPDITFEELEYVLGNDVKKICPGKVSDGDDWNPWPHTVGGKVRASAALANIDDASGIDIIIGSNDNYIHAYDHDRDTIEPYPLPLFGDIVSDERGPLSPVIGDIDGDEKSEVVLSSYDGYLHAWENMDSDVAQYLLEWPQFHHDYQRTGKYNSVGGLGGGGASPGKFSTTTTISFSLKAKLPIQVKIYNSEWKVVKTLVDQVLPKGDYNPVWYGKDDNYKLLPNGVYYIEFRINDERRIIPVEINR